LNSELKEDIAAGLEHFAKLARLGMIEKAKKWYDGCLEWRAHRFPIRAEYVDMLLQEGEHQEVIRILDSTDYSTLTALGRAQLSDVRRLFNLTKLLAILRWKGML
ncbi:uncharacterized protein THITE_2015310, partial [Thermothielavioides terrestris NRRL 8126]